MSTVVVAVDSFKGSIGAAEAAETISHAWRTVRPDDDVILRPMADGGEGPSPRSRWPCPAPVGCRCS
ncbi:glycerate kinase [Tessaracoccus coleopterorum]|uniref:glycerate kinase n=1 Tax=Tessaracoccus coleopterorum TaxID=2714950 RepID=UPI0018D38350|nr:glycerate kinase [Tessaracoccus coleopterorum]